MRTFFIFCFLWLTLAADAGEIWVSPSGSDKNAGTKDKPLATVSMALRKAREMRRLNDPGVAGGIRIVMQERTYQLYEPVIVRPEDSGTPESPTTIEAAAGERPIFSGGIDITGWSKTKEKIAGLPSSAQGQVWMANVPARLEFR